MARPVLKRMPRCDQPQYKPEWVSMPEFRNWLRPDPISTKHVLCRLCDIQLRATDSQIRRHTSVTHPEFMTKTSWKPNKRYVRYNAEWQKLPELSGWLSRSPHNPDFAFCQNCNKEFIPTLQTLLSHATNKLHTRRCRRPASARLGPTALAADEAGGDADGGGTKWRRRRAQTVEMWAKEPEYAPWLRRSAADWTKAFCLFCYKELTAKLILLQRHADSKLHKRRTAATVANMAKGAVGADCGEQPESESEAEAEAASPSPPHESPALEGGGGSARVARLVLPARESAQSTLSPQVTQKTALSPLKPAQSGKTPQKSFRSGKTPQKPTRSGQTPQKPTRSGQTPQKPAHSGQTPQKRFTLSPLVRLSQRSRLDNSGEERVLVLGAGFGASAGTLVDIAAAKNTREPEDEAGEEDSEEAASGDRAVVDDHESDRDAPVDGPRGQSQDSRSPRSLSGRLSTYQPAWEKVPELRDWLCRSPWDDRRPFCRWCHRQVTAKPAHLRRHARTGVHLRNKPPGKMGQDSRTLERPSEAAGSGPQTAGHDCSGEEDTTADSCQQAELGPFGTCVVCKHPLVVRLNIFRSRTRPSRRLVASLLSSLVQRPLGEVGCDPSESEICTSCLSLLETLDDLQTKLTAVENEVKLKFNSPVPLMTSQSDDEDPSPGEREDQEPETVTETSLQEGGTVAGTEPVALVTIADHEHPETSSVVVRTETLDNGDLVIYREAVEPSQPEPPDVMSSHSPATTAAPDLRSAGGHHPADLPRSVPGGRGVERRHPTTAGRRSVGERRSFDCAFCQWSFGTSLELHQHCNTEHPLQLHPCRHCPKRFLYRSSLNQHVKTHGVRRHTCELCGRQFYANCDLNKHKVLVHSEVKSHRCDVCGKAFKLRWMRDRHVRLLHREDRC